MCFSLSLESVLYQLAAMTSAEILEKKQSRQSKLMSNIADNRPDYLNTGHMRNTQLGPNDGLDSLCSRVRKSKMSPPWISSYPVEIVTVYVKIKSHSQIFLTDNNK